MFVHAGELPLRDGATWQDRGDRIEIKRFSVTGNVFRLKIHEQQLSLIFSARNSYGRHNSHPWVLVLVNRAAKTAILVNRNDSPMAYRGTGWISPFLRGEETIDLNLRHALGRDLQPGEREDWLEHAKLVVVRKNNLGSASVDSVVDAEPIRQNLGFE